MRIGITKHLPHMFGLGPKKTTALKSTSQMVVNGDFLVRVVVRCSVVATECVTYATHKLWRRINEYSRPAALFKWYKRGEGQRPPTRRKKS